MTAIKERMDTKMAIRSIIKLGSPILREVAEPIHGDEFSSQMLDSLLDDLRDTLREFQRVHQTGRGIAAPQIGVSKRVICIECGEFAFELVNPRFIYKSPETFKVWDSCFSYWGVEFEVTRHYQVTMEYYTRAGERQVLTAEGALSELLQHEMEHLDGVLAIDMLVPPGKIAAYRVR